MCVCVCVFLFRGRIHSDPLHPSTRSCDHYISPLSLVILGVMLGGCLHFRDGDSNEMKVTMNCALGFLLTIH